MLNSAQNRPDSSLPSFPLPHPPHPFTLLTSSLSIDPDPSKSISSNCSFSCFRCFCVKPSASIAAATSVFAMTTVSAWMYLW